MKDTSKRCGAVLITLAVLAGICPWTYAAAPETEFPAEDYTLENPLPEKSLNSENNIPQQEDLADTSLTSSTATVSYPVEGGNLYFDTATGAITSCDYEVTAAVIPETINGVDVTSIDTGAFWACDNLTTVVIGNRVESIGADAFSYCFNLSSVTIGSNVSSIGESAFSMCTGLTSITIPANVTSIGQGAFWDCKALVDIQVSDRNSTYTSSGGVLFNKAMMTLICCPQGKTGSYVVPAGVTALEEDAFHGCDGLTSITLPEGIKWIGDRAFSSCSSLTAIRLPDSVIDLGEYTFQYCSGLTEVTLSNNLALIPDYAFSSCSQLATIKIPTNVTSIGTGAFSYCSSLSSITIPNHVTQIGVNAFEHCSNMSTIVLGNKLASIGGDAFSYCSSLSNVTIPSSVISIGSHAFNGCASLTEVYFQGDAPDIAPASNGASFPAGTILYYIVGKAGWASPMWEGYDAVAMVGTNTPSESHTDYYYTPPLNYHFRFTGPADLRLTNVSLYFEGQSLSSGGSSELTVAIDGNDMERMVTLEQANSHSAQLPLYLLGTHNHISLYPKTYSTPFVQAAYGSQDGGVSYCDLLHSGMNFYAGSLTEKTAFYIDVNWGTQRAGKIYLSQTLDPEDGFELSPGLNDAQNISLYLKSSGGLYLLMETEDGKLFSQRLLANIMSEDTNFSFDFGEDIGIPTPSDNFLSKFTFGMTFPNDWKVKLSVEPDGTVLATLGVQISEGKNVRTAVKTIKDALYYADNYPKDWDSFIGALHGSIIPQSSNFVVSAETKMIGYLEGKVVQEEDGSYGILFTEGKAAVKIEGKVKKTWQIYAWGVPFYVGASIEPSMEFGLNLWSNEKETQIFTDPIEVKGKLPIKVQGGLGWDSIASAGIYGKGSFNAELTIPCSKNDLKVYANASFGAEAKFFCFSADVEIFKTNDLYLYGAPENRVALMQPMQLDAGTIDWQPQSRDYLYSPSLFSIGDDQTQTGVSTVASGIYPYADVQLAALEDGTQIMVWTADPGESVRPEANNRTMLYYTYDDGNGWSQPTPVESEDDGTGDFNPLLEVLDGTAYLLWQDASRPLTSTDDVTSTAALMDISVASFDPDTGAFHSLGTVGTDSYDGAVSAGIADDTLTVVWASNSGDNPLASDGQVGTLHRAQWDGEQWCQEILAKNLGTIDQTTTDGKRIWFSADTDYSANTLTDREIFLFDEILSQITQNNVTDTKPSLLNGEVLWYSGSTIVTERGESILLAEDTDRYCYVCSATGLEAIIYTVTGEDRRSTLYASFNDGTGWGQAIQLNSADGNIGSFSAQFLPDGTLSVVTSERDTYAGTGEYEVPELSVAAQLKIYSVTPVCDLALGEITYLAHSLVSNGTLDVQLEVENKGTAAVNMAKVAVMDGADILSEQICFVELLSGESCGLTLGVPLSDTIPEQLIIKVSPVGYSDNNTANDTAHLDLRLSDISLEGGTGHSDEIGTTATALVVNRGQTELSDVVVSLYDDDGSILDTATVPTLPIGASEFVTFSLGYPMENNSILKVEATGLGEENVMGNNSCSILISAQQEQKLTLSADYTETSSAISVVATVRSSEQESQNYVLYCASYDSAGKLLHTSLSEPMTIKNGEEISNQFILSSDPSASSIKVFLLNGNYIPLTEYTELRWHPNKQ